MTDKEFAAELRKRLDEINDFVKLHQPADVIIDYNVAQGLSFARLGEIETLLSVDIRKKL